MHACMCVCVRVFIGGNHWWESNEMILSDIHNWLVIM